MRWQTAVKLLLKPVWACHSGNCRQIHAALQIVDGMQIQK